MIVLIAPWSIDGLAYVAVLLVGMAWFIGHGRDRPLLALRSTAIGPKRTSAIERRDARVIDHLNARIIETTDDAVLIGFEGERQKVLGTSPRPLPLMCKIPSCEWDETADVESYEPAWSAPFVF